MNAGLRTTWPAAAWRLASISTLFVLLYAACNHVSHLRGEVGPAVFDWEQRIPFLPWTVVPYLSIFGFFVVSFGVDRDRQALDRYCTALVVNLLLAVACYSCVPLRFMFERPVPVGPFGPLFELLHAVDLPYNRAPSLHISMLVLLWWRLRPTLGCVGRALLGGWFLLIALSVLTTYQHHVIDIPAGAAAAGLSLAVGRRLCEVGAGRERMVAPRSVSPLQRLVGSRACWRLLARPAIVSPRPVALSGVACLLKGLLTSKHCFRPEPTVTFGTSIGSLNMIHWQQMFALSASGVLVALLAATDARAASYSGGVQTSVGSPIGDTTDAPASYETAVGAETAVSMTATASSGTLGVLALATRRRRWSEAVS